MAEFWGKNFQTKKAMWGFEPADSAITTAKLFLKKGLKKILVPSIGYGRNAKVFADNGCDVTGIEISKTAINIAKKHYGSTLKVHHGSVADMPFDKELYDGIYCYALIHLLNASQRKKLIKDCFNQLRPNGYMVFISISNKDPAYNTGTKLSENRFKTKHGVNLFFYNGNSIQKEFGKYGLIKATEITETYTHLEGKPSKQFWQIICRK